MTSSARGEVESMQPEKGRRFPVIEVFGPTIQGEGALAGLPTMFVRFGGCDFRCSWCDSMYAVEPEIVRRDAEHLTATELLDRVLDLAPHPMWVTLSGGNPALMPFDTRELDGEIPQFPSWLQAHGFKVAVETQGSVWRSWLGGVDHLTISPKPPSSGMATPRHREQLGLFLGRAASMPIHRRSLKVVVFDDADYLWARELIEACNGPDSNSSGALWAPWDTYLSVGTVQPGAPSNPVAAAKSGATMQARQQIGESYARLCEKVAADPVFSATRVLPQLHVIAWGHAKGV